MRPAAELLARLEARGVTVQAVEGGMLRVRPASAVTSEEFEALRVHKPAVLDLLRARHRSASASIALDPETVRDAFGPHPDPHELACIRFDVLGVVRRLEQEIEIGAIAPRLRLVRGRPLAEWLELDEVARLLAEWGHRHTRRPAP